MVLGNDAFEGRLNHLDGRSREHIEIEVIAIHSVLEDLVQQFDIVFQANRLAHLIQMLLAHFLAKLGIMQQQVGQLRALLTRFNLAMPCALRSNSAVGIPTNSLNTYPESSNVRV